MDQTFYTCPYCKEEYSNPSDLAHCILSCEDKKKREEEERKKAELALEKEARQKEVENAFENLQKLMKEFVNDYGAIAIRTDSDERTPLHHSKLWPWWF